MEPEEDAVPNEEDLKKLVDYINSSLPITQDFVDVYNNITITPTKSPPGMKCFSIRPKETLKDKLKRNGWWW